jgi:hypothetical protein
MSVENPYGIMTLHERRLVAKEPRWCRRSSRDDAEPQGPALAAAATMCRQDRNANDSKFGALTPSRALPDNLTGVPGKLLCCVSLHSLAVANPPSKDQPQPRSVRTHQPN